MSATDTTDRVPSPEMQATEAPPAQLPAARPAAPYPLAESAGFGNVVGAIAAVMADIQPVGKGGENTFHHYKYARMQDISQMLTPLMGRHGLAVFQHEIAREMFDEGRCIAIRYQFTVAHKSGEVMPERPEQTGMAPCRHFKPPHNFDDKCIAKAHTSARKYFLLSLFQIPTEDEDDPDNEKRRKAATPVPGPDGRVPPHRIEHVGSTFQKWANSYLTAIRAAKSADEIRAWDNANDEALGLMSNEPKAEPVYSNIMAEQQKLLDALGDEERHSGLPEGEKRARAAALAEARQRAQADKVPSPDKPIQRPQGCPDPERDPEGFIVWAEKRMAAITSAAELDVIFEQEIDPAADGMMPPDYAAVQNLYELNKKRLGSD